MWFRAKLVDFTKDGESCEGLLVSSIKIRLMDLDEEVTEVRTKRAVIGAQVRGESAYIDTLSQPSLQILL